MHDTQFSKLAEQTIASIADIIEKQDQDCLIDIDLQGDILNLTTVHGVYVLNKHSAAKEIWLSSPISGPYHFAYKSGLWQSRASISLFEILSNELQLDFRANFSI